MGIQGVGMPTTPDAKPEKQLLLNKSLLKGMVSLISRRKFI